MKKPARPPVAAAARRRKLTLPRETIAELTPAQLGEVAGGELDGGSVGPRCATYEDPT